MYVAAIAHDPSLDFSKCPSCKVHNDAAIGLLFDYLG